MANWLSKLRKKPKHVRDNLALGSSVGLTLVVALVWFIAGGSTNVADKAKIDPGFFKTFKEGFNKQMATARDSLSKPVATSTATSASSSQSVYPAATTTSENSASTTPPKPVLIEIINASGTASSTNSSSS